jgi:suppressor for copper-sensitivity B
MALPYLAEAVWPDAALKMPRPGAWMVSLRKALGLALAGTGLWLLSVLAAQVGASAALVSGGAVALAILVLALKPRMPERSRQAVGACVIALAGLALAAPYQGAGSGQQAATESGTIPWIVFDRAALPRLVADGKLVFVDVTADWCITCKVNKAAVIERGQVAKRLSADGVIAMKADWTKPDEGISRYLASFGRYGIPFNAVYGPAAPDGIPLSELLNEADLLAALDKAAGITTAR